MRRVIFIFVATICYSSIASAQTVVTTRLFCPLVVCALKCEVAKIENTGACGCRCGRSFQVENPGITVVRGGLIGEVAGGLFGGAKEANPKGTAGDRVVNDKGDVVGKYRKDGEFEPCKAPCR